MLDKVHKILDPENRRPVLLFVLCSVLALLCAFRLCTPAQLSWALVNGGYFYVGFVFCLAAYFLYKTFRSNPCLKLGYTDYLFIGLASLIVVFADVHQHKILFDEYVLDATAYNMHLFKKVGTVCRAYDFDGSFLPVEAYLDKRPYFFAFLLSLIHDLLGYRSGNVFILNGLLGVLLIYITYQVTNHLANLRAARVSVCLLATLPLVAQLVSSGAMEIQNMTVLALTFWLALVYYQKPKPESLITLCLWTVLLALSRYESILYVFPVAVVIVLGWIKNKSIFLPKVLYGLPFLYIPVVWHSRYLDNMPSMWELKAGQTSRFSLSYLAGNVEGFWAYFSNISPFLPNSIFLTFNVLISILLAFWLVYSKRRQWRQGLFDSRVVLVVFLLSTLLSSGLMLFYYWGRLDDLMATRFSLPLCYFLAIFCGVILSWLFLLKPYSMRIWCFFGLVYACVFYLPSVSNSYFTITNMVAAEVTWELDVVADMPPVGRLVVTNKSPIPWLLKQVPSILIDRAKLTWGNVLYHVEQGTFHEVLVIQSLRPTSIDGDLSIAKEDELPPDIELQTIEVKRFGGRYSRISRIVITPELLKKYQLGSFTPQASAGVAQCHGSTRSLYH